MENCRYVRSIQHIILLTLCSIQSFYYRQPFKMSTKSLLRFATYSSLTIGSFFTGIAYERNRFINKLDQTADPYILYARNDIRNLTAMPGLPIFGNVSAAKSFVPDAGEKPQMASTGKRVSEIMKYGFPSLDNVRSYSDFVLSYDRRNRVAHWVFEHLTAETVKSNPAINRSKSNFKQDASIHPYFRSDNADYKGSGFDRGHLAAAGNHKSNQEHCDQTFYLTNMAPQVGAGFNRDSWNRLEKHVRKLTQKYKNVYVCTGTLYLPKKEADGKSYVRYQVIGSNSVAVPTHFYKVIVGETSDGKLELESYVMPNRVIDDKTPLAVFQVAPETVERSAGLLFFDRISKKQLTKINGKPAK